MLVAGSCADGEVGMRGQCNFSASANFTLRSTLRPTSTARN
jgi:hypothetical protein